MIQVGPALRFGVSQNAGAGDSVLINPRGVTIEAFRTGQVVVFARSKRSTRPGVRARDVSPARHGDTYTYVVDKFWIVAGQLPDGRLRLLTRTGKEHLIDASDPRLRKPSIWQRLFMRHKFPSPDLCSSSSGQPREPADQEFSSV